MATIRFAKPASSSPASATCHHWRVLAVVRNQIDSNTVTLYLASMTESFSLDELSQRINAWCAEHEIAPASGQAGETVSERNVRYYRTLGLIDAPEAGAYGEKHLLQLTAVRLLQAQGLPLRRIRELIYGRSLEDLREIRRRGLMDANRVSSASRFALPAGDELWRAIPLDEDFLIVSRRGTSLTPFQREAVLEALRSATPSPSKDPSKQL